MLRRISALVAVGAAAGLAAGSAGAATTYSGSVPNGGCDANQQVVQLSGPSRIDADVSSTSSSNTAYADILGPDGAVLASGSYASYDTTGGGRYSIRICSSFSQFDPPTLQYTATYATGPAGQPALPRTQAQLAANPTTTRAVNGTGAIRTAKGLAFFTVKMKSNGLALVRVFNPRANTHSTFTNAGVKFLANGVSLTQGRMIMRIVEGSSGTRIVYRSPHFKASGAVVRGSYLIV